MNNRIRPICLLLAACSLLLAVAPPARAAEVIAHWSFDQLSDDGKSFPDVNGNLAATISDKSAAALDNGKDVPFGKGASLGPGGNGLSIPSLPGLYEHSFTVAGWVKLASNSNDYLLSDWTKPNAYAFGFANGKVICMLRNSKLTSKGQTSDIINSKTLNIPITTGAWHHVAWVWDRISPKAGTLTVYLDGAHAGEAASTGKVPTAIANNSRPPTIGYKGDSKTAFHGSIDELWIFNDALSAEQVANLMKSNDIAGGNTFSVANAAPTPALNTPSTPAAPAAATPAPASSSPPASENVLSFAPSVTPTPAPSTPSAATPTPAASTPVTPSAPAAPTNFSITQTPHHDTPAVAAPVAPPIVAVAAPHYTPGRIAGIITSGATALLLSGFLFWATQERGKMRHARQ